MYKKFIFLCLSISTILSAHESPKPFEVAPSETRLKKRQPNWRTQIMETHEDGGVKTVLFFETTPSGIEIPVKMSQFYSSGSIEQEVDLDDSNTPHGASISYYPNRAVQKIAFYHKGSLYGPVRKYFPTGKLYSVHNYKENTLHGKMEIHDEHGNILEEANYINGKLEGPVVRTHPNKEKAFLAHFVHGVIEGEATEWNDQGTVISRKFYSKGLLNNDADRHPALTLFYDDGKIREVQNFQQGQPFGTLIKYHPNGKESYRLSYKEGKKTGQRGVF